MQALWVGPFSFYIKKCKYVKSNQYMVAGNIRRL